MTITVVFDPPLPSDSPATFNTKAFTLLGDLNDWSTEANALAVEVNADEVALASAVYNASTSASNALASENAAAASLDSFDDRYLGSKASAPTLDNDGNALITGALYWDSVASAMFVRTSGGAWTALNASTGIAQAITVNSASAALTVTQTGAGNAFVVEDSTSPDSTPVVIDAGGNVLVGHSTFRNNFLNVAASTKLQVEGTDFITSSASIVRNGGAVAAAVPYLIMGRTNGTAVGSNTIVTADAGLGGVSFQGSDGAELVEAATIQAYVDGTPGTNDMPGRLVFSTTADGASSPTERMRIDSAGLITIAAGQIKFPATQNASADANTLDDYEEGTFTPAIAFGGLSVGVAYTVQLGRYTKIGRQVFYSVYFVLSSKGSSTGSATITGLPFTVTSETNFASTMRVGSVTAGVGDTMLQALITSSGTAIALSKVSAGGAPALADTDFTATTNMAITGNYFI